MEYLRVKNWDQFQHYKERNPPWIKLHRDLLRDYNFNRLHDASKLHLILIWLLASQMDNRIPADADFIKRQIGVSDCVDFKCLINAGFLIDDSNTLASCKQSAMPETETETKKEKEYTSDFGEFWSAYPKTRAGSKDQAQKAYAKAIKREDSKVILEAAKKYAQSDEVAKGFAKGCAAWLNDDRWKSQYKRHDGVTFEQAEKEKEKLEAIYGTARR